ncbi:MAG: hypothetical protein N2C14_21855 [Planctomycetales bacterium]
MRISAPTRYVPIDKYLESVAYASQVIVSHRDGVMRKLARTYDLPIPSRDWPQRFDDTARRLVEKLAGSSERLIVFVYPREVTAFASGKRDFS